MLATKIAGEPYEGKLHVRFDEGDFKYKKKRQKRETYRSRKVG
jgi:hypothetical protein